MQTLLFCFANSGNPPLETLQKEYEGIDSLLDARNNLKHFLKVPLPFATTDSVVQKINTYRDSLAVFHFSGHAGQTVLLLEDTAAGAKGMARLLARCPNLKLVFLNGCSTKKHIEQMTTHGVKAVIIATHAPVKDPVATKFSKAFYTALERQCSLAEAIQEARYSIVDAGADQLKFTEMERGSFQTSDEVSDDQWYFFCPDPQLAQWKLPTSAETSSYKPNVTLRQTLFEVLGDQDPTFYDAYETVQSRYADDGLLDWTHKQILERLPYPLAEPLRRLFRREFIPTESRWLPVALSPERLQNYLILVDNGLYLVISAYLAQVRDRLLELTTQPQTPVDSATLVFLKGLLTEDWRNYSPEQLVKAIRTLHTLPRQWNIPLFVEGMADLMDELTLESPLYDSLLFFQELRQQLASTAGVPNMEYYCEVGEMYLKPLLEQLGFWVHYRLESIRNIRVIQSFDLQARHYTHEKVVLRSNLSEDPTEKVLTENEQDTPWNCQSVLLVNEQNQYLNLSPFIIDRNVYKKSSTIFDLHSLNSFEAGRLTFSRLAFPGHPPLQVFLNGPNGNPQEDFSLLRRQVTTLLTLIHLENSATPVVPSKPVLRI